MLDRLTHESHQGRSRAAGFTEIPQEGLTDIHPGQPVKIGWLFDTLFIEVHPPLEEKQKEPAVLVETVMDQIYEVWEQQSLVLNVPALKEALEKQNGMPVAIGHSVLD